MKKFFAIIALAMLTLSASAQSLWDFSNLSGADKALLDADHTNWAFDADKQRYANTAAYQPANETLKAGGQELDVTRGLLFTATKKERIRLSVKEKYQVLQLNGDGLTVTIPNAKAGQRILVLAKTGKGGEAHGLTATNVKADAGSFVRSEDKLYNLGTVETDGPVTLTTDGGAMVIYRIEVASQLTTKIKK